MKETRQNKEGTRTAKFARNPSSSHAPSHRYTVTLIKKSRVKETEIHRHVRTQADARELSSAWVKGEL